MASCHLSSTYVRAQNILENEDGEYAGLADLVANLASMSNWHAKY